MEAHAATVLHPGGSELLATARLSERRVAWLYVCTGLTLFCVMGLAGLSMRLSQAEVITLSPSWFYRLMTLHGAGMLVGALLAMMGALWFVLRTTVPLHLGRMLASYVAIVGGAVLVVIAVLFGGFASGWTFLWPLPFDSFGAWRHRFAAGAPSTTVCVARSGPLCRPSRSSRSRGRSDHARSVSPLPSSWSVPSAGSCGAS